MTVAADPIRKGALAALRTGRVTVYEVRPVALGITISAKVQSSRPGGHTYAVDYAEGLWHCTCQDRHLPTCAHRRAVQLVTDTGWPEVRASRR